MTPDEQIVMLREALIAQCVMLDDGLCSCGPDWTAKYHADWCDTARAALAATEPPSELSR